MNIRRYIKYLNDSFLRRVFSKKYKRCVRSKLISKEILKLIKDKGINDWNSYNNMKDIDQDIVNSIIFTKSEDIDQIMEIKFLIRYVLSDKRELMVYLKTLELNEEYEKCQMVFDKIINKHGDN